MVARRRTGREGAGRSLLVVWLVVLTAVNVAWHGTVRAAPPAYEVTREQREFLERLQHDTFAFFWDASAKGNGLTPDRSSNPDLSSVAAVGFALTAYSIGVEKGWITRAQAADRTLSTLRFLWLGRQGPEPQGVMGYKGFFYHFLDARTGHRAAESELSTIDTALLMAGVLEAQAFFDRPGETGARHPKARRSAVPQGRLGVGDVAQASPASEHGMDAGAGVSPVRLAGIQRSHDPRTCWRSVRRLTRSSRTRGTHGPRPIDGTRPMAFRAWRSTHSSGISTATSGSIFAGSRIRTCGRRESTTS